MKILQLTILIFLSNIAFGQIEFFKDYDFESGEYYLLGTRSESDRNDLADSLGEWYTDDISVLKEFKTEWTFTEPGKKYACGYHYVVYLCKDGLALESFAINLNCNEIVGDKGYFYFETTKLSKFKNNLKKSYRERKTFNNIDSARKYRVDILKDSNLIFTPTPNWTRFEGTFDFDFKCEEANKDCLNNEEKVLKQLSAEIKSKYPQEEFELEERGGSSTEVFVEVKCNKTLEEKFDLYERHPEYDKWDPFRLYLTTYWIKK